jgi:hypothetical protein
MAITPDRRPIAQTARPSRLRQLVLLVEPNGPIARTIERGLAATGLQAKRAPWTAASQFDGVLANAAALGVDLREPNIPVLRYSVHKRGQEIGFSLDGNSEPDPLDADPFCRRVRARLRPSPLPSWPGDVAVGPLQISTSAFRIHSDGREIVVTAVEFRLLVAMVEAAGRVLSREDLLRQVWGIRRQVSTRTVDTHVKRLRGKLGPAAWVVDTVRSFGYRVAAPVPDLPQGWPPEG